MTVLASLDPFDGGVQDEGPWDFSGNFSEAVGGMFMLTPFLGSIELGAYFGVQDLVIDPNALTNGTIAYSFTTGPGKLIDDCVLFILLFSCVSMAKSTHIGC